MKIQYDSDKIVIGIIPLIIGNGGNYIATNIAYEYANIFKKQDKKIALIDMRNSSDLGLNLIVNKDELTTHLKFNIDLYSNINTKESFDAVRSSYDIIITVLDFEQLKLFNSFSKKKTSILVLKKNLSNLKKLEENIDAIKESNIKYSIFNCPEKTNKVNFKLLKENGIINILNVPYNEFTVDNCNIEYAKKINKIKYIKLFKRVNFIKVKIKK